MGLSALLTPESASFSSSIINRFSSRPSQSRADADRDNVIGLAKFAKAFNVPVILDHGAPKLAEEKS